ncbi:hypothetical protein [Lysobacter xanthus]
MIAMLRRPIAALRAGCALALALAVLLSGCQAPPTGSANAPAPGVGDGPVAPAATASAPAASSPSPAPMSAPADAGTAPAPLAEPRGPVASTSPQAAATLVETYFALLAADKTRDADSAWGANTSQAAEFRTAYDALGRPGVEVDAPGDPEGAAGSIYVTVPVRFLPTATGNGRPRMGEVLVRRVNDVPGSTDAQRRWHIERIDVAMTPK